MTNIDTGKYRFQYSALEPGAGRATAAAAAAGEN